jgi:hypothetical protein
MTYGVLQSAREVAHQATGDLFNRKHVVACGLGYKVREGQQTDELSLVVSVVKKLPEAELQSKDLVPKAYAGLPTDVVETGRIRPLMAKDPRTRWRPAQPGVSIGHRDITAGTFGLLVQRDGTTYILSNNHVLANSNAGRIGDPIYQPGPADGGTSDDKIATLFEFEPLDFGDADPECSIAQTLADLLNWLAKLVGSSHRLQPMILTPGLNLIDAALARPDQPDLVIPDIPNIGIPTGTAEPLLGQTVQKMGRTTGYTSGTIIQVDVTVDIDYGGRTARFAEQIFTSPMSSPGDSGSGILDMQNRAVGLLFAGSELVTIFTPIRRILDHFGVDVVIL